MTPHLPLLIAAAAMFTSLGVGRKSPRAWLAITLVGVAAALWAAVTVLTDGTSWEWRSSFLLGGEPLHLRLDSLSAFFLVLLCVVGGAGSVYAREYWADAAHPRSARAGRVWWTGMLFSLGFVLLASNGLHFLIAWELFTLCAYFLITLNRQRHEVRAAGWLYIGASHAATLALFAFFTILAVHTGSWDLGPLRNHPELAPLFWLALFGFGLKAGLFPLHIWLPAAHANAPSHVSAVLSGVTLKIGIYGLMRFSGWLPLPDGAGWVVTVLGVTSAVLGVAFALGQHDLKRLLAYHSVENIGIILIGFGFALVAVQHGSPAWGRLAAHGPAASMAISAAILLGITGALALACFTKVCGVVFLGAPRSPAAAHAHECGPAMRGSMLVLGAACVAIGLAPVVFWPAVVRAMNAWNPAWAGAATPVALTSLGLFHMALAVVALAVAGWLWRRVRQGGVTRALTWDCAYALPTARMQYTAGSFAGIITEWFKWVLRPERHQQLPDDCFPAAARHAEHTPETVLEKIVEPAAVLVMRLSALVRSLQHGRLQAYLLYLLIGVAALALLVLLGGNP